VSDNRLDAVPLPFDAPLEDYDAKADVLLHAWRVGHPVAVEIVRCRHPRFIDADVAWLANRDQSDAEAMRQPFDIGDAREVVARAHDFRDRAALVEYVASVRAEGSGVRRFEAAVEAVVDGDLTALRAALSAHPELVHARSTRVTGFDPPAHRATLLHYVAANGVEGYRQRTPSNAVEIARTLLEAGADPDARADLYGGECTTLSLLVSSGHPAGAGLQIPLAETLVAAGASLEPLGRGHWTSPVQTALVFGYADTARALVRLGARVDSLSTAAGLGLVEPTRGLIDAADADERHRALALAAALGESETVRLLLDAGGDPNRFNPPGTHAHSTPLHQAALAGHLDTVRLLVARGARLDTCDTIHRSTPLGWAAHGGHTHVAAWLRDQGAS
jgi:ankyrin repeat protein